MTNWPRKHVLCLTWQILGQLESRRVNADHRNIKASFKNSGHVLLASVGILGKERAARRANMRRSAPDLWFVGEEGHDQSRHADFADDRDGIAPGLLRWISGELRERRGEKL